MPWRPRSLSFRVNEPPFRASPMAARFHRGDERSCWFVVPDGIIGGGFGCRLPFAGPGMRSARIKGRKRVLPQDAPEPSLILRATSTGRGDPPSSSGSDVAASPTDPRFRGERCRGERGLRMPEFRVDACIPRVSNTPASIPEPRPRWNWMSGQQAALAASSAYQNPPVSKSVDATGGPPLLNRRYSSPAHSVRCSCVAYRHR